MFTGIVQTLAKVLSINNLDKALQLTVVVENTYAKQVELGASIAINGVCLTVSKYSQYTDNHTKILFDVIDETLRVTNLGRVNTDEQLNFERSLKMSDELGGHIVSGHIHCQAKLLERIESDNNCQLVFKLQTNKLKNNTDEKTQWIDYIFDKGFITVNGTSLTVGKVSDATFTVHLIPETLTRTNLGILSIGDFVNIECDQQTITIVNTIKRINLRKLMEK